ncbi:putative ankyrin repeat protein [Megavirus lba]|uniref:Putative ankyrin repeat protein n=1 Tax=Megavirus lba TaxID=1235314 RepID=L7Y667_9VIRU|nr:putative ankyrin repeat protein [Megavirus lba]
MTCIIDLPNEILVEIIKYIDTPDIFFSNTKFLNLVLLIKPKINIIKYCIQKDYLKIISNLYKIRSNKKFYNIVFGKMTNKKCYHESCVRGKINIIDYFEKYHSYTKYEDPFYYLIVVCEYGHLDLAKYFINKGANFRKHKDCAMRLAAKNGHLDLVKYFVEKGANITAKNNYVLKKASKYGHLHIIKYLYSIHIYLHSDDNYAYRIATKYNHLNIIKYLNLDSYLIPWWIKKDSLFHFSESGNLEAVKYLADYVERMWWDYALVCSSRNGHIEIVKYFVEKGANIYAHEENPLICACKYGYTDIILYLIEKGMSIDDNKLSIYVC